MRSFLVLILSVLLWALPFNAWAASGKAPLFAVSYAQAEEAVSQALAKKGAGLKIGAMINGSSTDTLFSHTAPLHVEIRGLQFDKRSRHWSGNLLAISHDGDVLTAMPAAGRFDVLTEVPVLKRAVRNGEIIAAKDIEIRDIPIGQVRSDTVTDMTSLIGKSPTHSISAFRPMREHEINEPPVVKKNSLVKMRYLSPGMEISTTGQAMEDGAVGSVISVRNMASKRVVQAVVEDSASVTVAAPSALSTSVEAQNNRGDIYARN